jgi:1-acyl-sn-glycerol-3-phosphate acyltransferase
MSGCPVVPVVCRGTARALPRGRIFPRLRTRVDIVIGEPFHVTVTSPLRRQEVHRAAREIAEQLRALVEEVGLE